MNDETTITAKPAQEPSVTTTTQTTIEGPVNDSQFFNISVRAWLAIVLTLTVCGMSLAGKDILEPLYGLAYLAIGFFFGQKTPGQKP